ncbi:acetate/propionate family kinase [Salinisphaera sp. SPP-AMP-43]|uniref:acetate/propionate family kinase n=1 Tax=Salinisphaera sp. SPP-AMP-43 TaxID=3121288 RepID=UPI003C6E8ADB
MGYLIVNAGSSSLKMAWFCEQLERRLNALVDYHESPGMLRCWDSSGSESEIHRLPSEAEPMSAALEIIMAECRNVFGADAVHTVGHRVVHGGTRYRAPVRLDETDITALAALAPLAPQHQPFNVAGIEAIARAYPGLAQVACFDTAFHQSQPEVVQRLAVPRIWFDQGVRHYGFHGLSYEYIAGRLGELDPAAATGRTIVAHLGHGASLCALKNGRSIDTSMGFSTLDGLPMGTRCGRLDPGVLLYWLAQGQAPETLRDVLYNHSGLLGVSGFSDDMRVLLASETAEAAEAIALFVYRCIAEIGALVAVLGGLDALVFTGGIGEHAAPIRERIVAGLDWLGVRLDPRANADGALGISRPDSVVRLWVVSTDEEQVIAMHCRRLERVASGG